MQQYSMGHPRILGFSAPELETNNASVACDSPRPRGDLGAQRRPDVHAGVHPELGTARGPAKRRRLGPVDRPRRPGMLEVTLGHNVLNCSQPFMRARQAATPRPMPPIQPPSSTTMSEHAPTLPKLRPSLRPPARPPDWIAQLPSGFGFCMGDRVPLLSSKVYGTQ